MTAAIAIRLTPGFPGYYGAWRFSEPRSASSATPGLSAIVGTRPTRCMTADRSR
jgi:hypothetical protein